MGVELAQVRDGCAACGDIRCKRTELLHVPGVEHAVRCKPWIVPPALEVFLMLEVGIYIIQQEVERGRGLRASLPDAASVEQFVNACEQLAVFAVNQAIPG